MRSINIYAQLDGLEPQPRVDSLAVYISVFILFDRYYIILSNLYDIETVNYNSVL